MQIEVLGEKAFPEGYVDILIKEAIPTGIGRKMIIEIKTGPAKEQDINQLRSYTDEIGKECIAAILIANKFSKKLIQKAQSEKIKILKYNFEKFTEMRNFVTFEDLFADFNISTVEKRK